MRSLLPFKPEPTGPTIKCGSRLSDFEPLGLRDPVGADRTSTPISAGQLLGTPVDMTCSRRIWCRAPPMSLARPGRQEAEDEHC